MNFLDLFDKVAEYKNFTEEQKEELLARFYTDLNVDGRFTTLGQNMWGLKRWYPVDQTSEKALAESRKRDAEDDVLDDELLEEEEDELFDDLELEDVDDLVEDDVLFDEFAEYDDLEDN